MNSAEQYRQVYIFCHPHSQNGRKAKRMDDELRCYECTGYGDDYYFDDEGNLVRACDDCPFNGEDDEEDE